MPVYTSLMSEIINNFASYWYISASFLLLWLFGMLNKYFTSIIIAFLMFASSYANASLLSKSSVLEIEHLLNYIRTSDCIFIRNGSEYNGVDAVPHIQKKFDYFKEDIKSAEDFIEYSATKSTMSKKPYFIRCPSQTKRSSKLWLLDELKRYRQIKQ